MQIDIEGFKERNPNFAKTKDEIIESAYKVARMILDNGASSRVADESKLLILLEFLMCHMIVLWERGGEVVGNVKGGSAGSVDLNFAYSTGMSAEWFSQTQYGATYYQLIKPYMYGKYYAG